jgi:hypothetical protein
MVLYCLSRAKAWHSLERECAQHCPKPEVLVCSSLAFNQLFFHTCEHCSAPVKDGSL